MIESLSPLTATQISLQEVLPTLTVHGMFRTVAEQELLVSGSTIVQASPKLRDIQQPSSLHPQQLMKCKAAASYPSKERLGVPFVMEGLLAEICAYNLLPNFAPRYNERVQDSFYPLLRGTHARQLSISDCSQAGAGMVRE